MMATDWQIGKSLPDRMNHMLTHQLLCDVTFLVGSEKAQIRAHKFMLASSSPVFYSMFEGPMAEKGEVAVIDIEPKIFTDILTFIYTDQVNVHPGNIQGLLYGSEKYMLKVLTDKCIHFLNSTVNNENACVVFVTAYKFHLDHLEKSSFQFILQNGQHCLDSESFLPLSKECVKLIIESDELCCKEEFIFNKVIDWAIRRIQEQGSSVDDEMIRKTLGELLYAIRFPEMERMFFTNSVSTRHILSLEEIVSVYQSYDKKRTELFPMKSRRPVTCKTVQFIRCEVDKNGQWTHNGEDDCLDFKTDFNASLTDIMVFGSKTTGQYDVSLSIYESSSLLNSTKTTVQSKYYGQDIYAIKLSEPVHIKEKITYTVKLNMKGPPAFKGKQYISTVKSEDNLSVTFINSSMPSTNSTSTRDGQIPGIILTSN